MTEKLDPLYDEVRHMDDAMNLLDQYDILEKQASELKKKAAHSELMAKLWEEQTFSTLKVGDMLVARIKYLESENSRLREELDDIKKSFAETIDEPCLKSDDRKHCACVPPLRMEIEKLRSEIKKRDEALGDGKKVIEAYIVIKGEHFEFCPCITGNGVCDCLFGKAEGVIKQIDSILNTKVGGSTNV